MLFKRESHFYDSIDNAFKISTASKFECPFESREIALIENFQFLIKFILKPS